MREAEKPTATFADIAVALKLASSKMRLELTHTRLVAERIGLSAAGIDVTLQGLEHDVALVDLALETFKEMSECEAEVRALLYRKSRGRWLPSFGRAAAG